jgi:CRP-like cAMP-binding protein
MSIEIISKLVPYSDLCESLQKSIGEKAKLQNIKANSKIFSEGEDADNIYFLLKGKVVLSQQNGKENSRSPSAMSISQGYTHYRHSALAEQDSVVVKVSITPEEQDALLCWEFAYRFLDKAAWVPCLYESEMFGHISPNQLLKFVQSFEKVSVTSGELIIKENDYERNFYVLIEGIADVYQGKLAEQSKPISQIHPLQTFGEASLMEDLPRNASIKMATQGLLMRLDTKRIEELKTNFDENIFINGAQLKQKVENEKAELLDIRPEKEAKLNPLKGAQLVSMDQPQNLLNKIQNKQSYIIYSPYRELNKLVYQLASSKTPNIFILKQA